MMTWTKNRLTGAIGILFGILYTVLSFNIRKPPGMTLDVLGSKTFPIVAGIIMLVSSLIIFLQRDHDDDEEEFGKNEIVTLLPYVLMVIIYIALLPITGTLITTILFMYFVMNRMSKGVWWKSLVISVSITICFWLLFVVLLKVQLPTGLLGVI
jgi:putative tricarboxylic transport membrane protein